ncbi:MAG: hypothetical protein NTU83_07845 [Candidatus Hydrogenedentes bacterium]|nr:hypothetical protein [Candidatus Hydrogenedentota bacterium]
MVKLLRALAAFETPLLEEVNAQRYALEHDCSRYFADEALKGGATNANAPVNLRGCTLIPWLAEVRLSIDRHTSQPGRRA